MPFTVNLSIDPDKLGEDSSRAGDLQVRYHAGSGEPNLGHWSHQGRYEAGNETEMIATVCAAFEEWRDKRQIEIEIEGRIAAAMEPLCPCQEPEPEEPEEEPETEPEPEPEPEE